MTTTISLPDRTSTTNRSEPQILTPGAVEFLRTLHTRFNPIRLSLLEKRKERQEAFDRGDFPRFLPETKSIRNGAWRVARIPEELLDRRVEITGPTERKMVINALNSGARVFMADFEYANSPTWGNCVEGQQNLIDANRRTIRWSSTDGRLYELGATPAVLFVRPR